MVASGQGTPGKEGSPEATYGKIIGLQEQLRNLVNNHLSDDRSLSRQLVEHDQWTPLMQKSKKVQEHNAQNREDIVAKRVALGKKFDEAAAALNKQIHALKPGKSLEPPIKPQKGDKSLVARMKRLSADPSNIKKGDYIYSKISGKVSGVVLGTGIAGKVPVYRVKHPSGKIDYIAKDDARAVMG